MIDEIQKAPELFPAIKLAVDKDRTSGRFLLTGSANVLNLAHNLALPGVDAGRLSNDRPLLGRLLESFVDGNGFILDGEDSDGFMRTDR